MFSKPVADVQSVKRFIKTRQMESTKDESSLQSPSLLLPVELKLNQVDCFPEEPFLHFQAQYLDICDVDYNVLQVVIENAAKTEASVEVGELCLVHDDVSERWYRGRVQSKIKDLVSVFLIDHGSVLIVGPGKLSSISCSLEKFPPKIIYGNFANILPVQDRWSKMAENYLSSLKGSTIKGHIHARLSNQVVILEVPDINRHLCKSGLGRHVDTGTFLSLVKMLTETPIPQGNMFVPHPLTEQLTGQEYGLISTNFVAFNEILSLNGPKLEPGQNVTVHVTAAVNPALFFCRLSIMEKDVQKMTHKLAEAFDSCAKSTSSKPLANLGLFCAVKGKDEKWHRGYVQCLSVNSQVQVVFVDSGYCESVKEDRVIQLPSTFLTPVMAFPCSLSCLSEQNSAIRSQQLETLKSGLLGKTLEVVIEGFCQDRKLYIVTLSAFKTDLQCVYQALENKSQPNLLPIKSDKVFETPDVCLIEKRHFSNPDDNLKEGSVFEGYVVHVQNPKNFWMQTNKQIPVFEKMMEEMSDFFKGLKLDEEVFENPVPGSLCCAMYEKDKQYYRAVIVDTLEKGAEVFFYDFGNTEKVPSVVIKKLPKKFAIEPEFALNCALAHVEPFQDFWTTTSSDFFQKVTSNKTLVVRVLHEKNRKYLVDLFVKENETECSIASTMAAAKMAEYCKYIPKSSPEPNMILKAPKKKPNRFSKQIYISRSNHIAIKPLVQQNVNHRESNEMPDPMALPPPTFRPIYLKVGTKIKVFCSHANSPTDFWCQSQNTKADLDRLMEEMQNYFHMHRITVEAQAICCAVKWSQDSRWYRASLLNSSREDASVMLVDYGFIVKEKMQNIQGLPPQFCELHSQAFRCSLNVTEPGAGDPWSEKVFRSFKQSVTEGSPTITCTILLAMMDQGRNLIHLVDISTPVQQVTTYAVENGVDVENRTFPKLFKSLYPCSFVYSPFNIHSGSEESVCVTNVCSPWEIYFQLDRNCMTLDDLMEKVAEAAAKMQPGVTAEDCCDNICLAKYFMDGQFYRAQIQPVNSQHVSVFFVDYGNSQISEKTKVVPIPKTAVDLLKTPMQAIRCCLSDIPEVELLPEVNVWLESNLLSKPLLAKFVANDSGFVCDLYDGNVHINEKLRELMAAQNTSLKELPIATACDKTEMQSKEPQVSRRKRLLRKRLTTRKSLPAARTTPGFNGLGYISHCNSLNNFFIQMEEDIPTVRQIDEHLNSIAFRKKRRVVTSEVKVGDIVIALRVQVSALCRAVVSRVTKQHLVVQYIDYGNSATVDRKHVYQADDTILSKHRLSTYCTFAIPYSDDKKEAFLKEADGKPLMVEFVKKQRLSWEVKLHIFDSDDTNGNSGKELSRSKCVVIPSKRQNKAVTCLSRRVGPENVSQEKVNSTASKPEMPVVAICSVGSNDMHHNHLGSLKDNGNGVELSPTSVDISNMPSQELNTGDFKTPNVVIIDDHSDWPNASLSDNTETPGQRQILVLLQNHLANSMEKKNGDEMSPTSPGISSHTTDESKTPSVVIYNHLALPSASSSDNTESISQTQTLFDMPVQLNIAYRAFAAAVTTPSDFYIVLEDVFLIIKAVDKTLENFTKDLTPVTEAHISPGMSCLVKSAEKNKWCRAEIVQRNSNSTLVSLVDYGQYLVLSQEDVGKLKYLPEELKWFPKVSYHCLLRGVKPNGTDWSDEAVVFFQKRMCHRNLLIYFKWSVSETQWMVDVIAENQSLSKELVVADHATNMDSMTEIAFRFQPDSRILPDEQDVTYSCMSSDEKPVEKFSEAIPSQRCLTNVGSKMDLDCVLN